MSTDALDPQHFPFRLKWVEDRAQRLEEQQTKNTVRIEDFEKGQAVDRQIISDLREDVRQLKRTLDRLVWAIVALAFTIAGTVIATGLGG